MGIFDSIYKNIALNVYQLLQDNPQAVINRAYYSGDQRKQLKVGSGKTDDNILANLVGLAVDRSVAHTLAGGVTFDLGEGREVQQEYIDAVYDANMKEVLMSDACLSAGVYGTGYLKTIPEGATNLVTGDKFPRLLVLNSEFMTTNTNKHDNSKVESYVIQYTLSEDGKDVTYRETTEIQDNNMWLVIAEHTDDRALIRWVEDSRTPWPYDFPPIIHWKNLPSLNSVDGSSDLDDILLIQDKNNFVLSNLQKMVRLQAHKQPWGRDIGDKDELNVGPDKIIKLRGEKAELGMLDFTADITGSLAYAQQLRQLLFDISREVDITSITDKLGALTNFGLRVLYSDSLAKVGVKRMLMGEMLEELNRRLLVIAGQTGDASNPGEVVWGDPLPSSKVEDMQADSEAIAMGIVSRQTIAEKNGYDWEVEQERIAQEKGSQDNAIGAALLRSFPGIGKA